MYWIKVIIIIMEKFCDVNMVHGYIEMQSDRI